MIRFACLDDYAQVELIMKQVHGLHVAWRPDVYRPVDPVMPMDFYEKLVREQTMLVYEKDGRVVGLAGFMERLVSGGPKVTKKTLFVDDIAVLEEHRGRGIGKALLEELKTIAKDRGCEGIELQVNAKNETAMAFYQHLGFGEKSINMEMYF